MYLMYLFFGDETLIKLVLFIFPPTIKKQHGGQYPPPPPSEYTELYELYHKTIDISIIKLFAYVSQTARPNWLIFLGNPCMDLNSFKYIIFQTYK